jgi:hypothetical protein
MPLSTSHQSQNPHPFEGDEEMRQRLSDLREVLNKSSIKSGMA